MSNEAAGVCCVHAAGGQSNLAPAPPSPHATRLPSYSAREGWRHVTEFFRKWGAKLMLYKAVRCFFLDGKHHLC